MNSKRFEYHTKDIPFLKKDLILRFVFALLFFVIFVWQFIAMVVAYNNQTIHTGMIILGVITLILSLFMAVMSFIYGYKSMMVMSEIKKRGKAVRNVSIIGSVRNKSFIRMYFTLTKVLAVVMAMLFIAGLTYTILQLVFYGTVPFYLPMLLWLTLSGFNSTYHVNNEIKTLEQVQEFNRAF